MVLSDSIKYTIMMKNFIMIICEKSLLQYGHVIYNEVQVIWNVYSLMEHHKEDESSQASWTLSSIEMLSTKSHNSAIGNSSGTITQWKACRAR